MNTLSLILPCINFSIAIFPKEKQFRDQLQKILTRDGNTAYLDRIVLADLFKIAVQESIDVSKVNSMMETSQNQKSTKMNKPKST